MSPPIVNLPVPPPHTSNDFQYTAPDKIDVDGLPIPGGYYVGWATRHPDGTYRALANVGDALVIVQCNVRSLGRTA
jgi:hypothetical protein